MEFDFKELTVNLSAGQHDRSYSIYIGPGMITKPEFWLRTVKAPKTFIISDSNVSDLYADRLRSVLDSETIVYKIEAGEKSKSFSVYRDVLDWLLENGLNRQSLVIALGGGVVGDLAGFVAATALRGVRFIQIPTTLLSQVDSSVGGKTGINSSFGKNLVGAFYQPQAVAIDTETLKTLPRREMLAGYAEIVKYALLGDERFFEWLEENGTRVVAGEEDALVYAIEKSCAMKAEIVRQDEFEETGLRALLNLGHTFAHALETACEYDGRLLHGEAVGIGLLLAARLSQKMNSLISDTDVSRIEKHLKTIGMMCEIRDIRPAFAHSAEDVLMLMRKDKKAAAKGPTFVLLNKIGRAKLDAAVPDSMALDIIERSMA